MRKDYMLLMQISQMIALICLLACSREVVQQQVHGAVNRASRNGAEAIPLVDTIKFILNYATVGEPYVPGDTETEYGFSSGGESSCLTTFTINRHSIVEEITVDWTDLNPGSLEQEDNKFVLRTANAEKKVRYVREHPDPNYEFDRKGQYLTMWVIESGDSSKVKQAIENIFSVCPGRDDLFPGDK